MPGFELAASEHRLPASGVDRWPGVCWARLAVFCFRTSRTRRGTISSGICQPRPATWP